MTRRKMLSLLLVGGGGTAVGTVAVPALITGLAPALVGREGELWRPVGPYEDFPTGAVTVALVDTSRDGWPRSLGPKALYVWRPSPEAFVVYSRSCTDLGCPLDYDPGSTCFYCPCHGGIFGQDGERMAGPPGGPMYRFAHRIQGGVLQIDLNSLPPGV